MEADKIQAFKERMAKARAEKKSKVHIEEVKPTITAAPAVHVKQEEKVVFFTETDYGRKRETGEKFIKHQYPRWYGRKEKEDIAEEIRMLEKGIENKYFPAGEIGAVRERLKRAKTVMDDIDQQMPSFEKQKDTLAKLRTEAGESLAPTMYKRNEETKGLVDAHDLSELWSQNKIEVTPLVADVARQNGIEVTKDRKMNQVNLSRLWQLASAALGESRNPEVLRRD